MNTEDSFPLIDSQDRDILMHRDAHFSGNFLIMLSYYADEGKGSYTEFEPKRIKALQEMEEAKQINLADELLNEEEKGQVSRAKEKYFLLRDIYNNKNESLSHRIADLILTEDLEAEEEITQIVRYGQQAVAPLISLVSQDDFYNPLFPGYGMAPAYAAKCLGILKDPRAIPALFSVLGHADFLTEEAVFDALREIGIEAQVFLMKSLLQQPFTKENENAAIALLTFPLDERISEVFLQALSMAHGTQQNQLVSYLILGCEGLKKTELQEEFKVIAKSLPAPEMEQEAKMIMKQWACSHCSH